MEEKRRKDEREHEMTLSDVGPDDGDKRGQDNYSTFTLPRIKHSTMIMMHIK